MCLAVFGSTLLGIVVSEAVEARVTRKLARLTICLFAAGAAILVWQVLVSRLDATGDTAVSVALLATALAVSVLAAIRRGEFRSRSE